MNYRVPTAEITEYDPGTAFVVSKTDLASLSDPTDLGSPTVIRYIYVDVPFLGTRSIAKILGRADQELAIAADMCEATVVPHKWGVIRSIRARRGLPYVVAEVDRIVDPHVGSSSTTLPFERAETIRRGVDSYNQYRKGKRYGLTDIRPDQFMYGLNIAQPTDTGDAAVYLLDIEPRFVPQRESRRGPTSS